MLEEKIYGVEGESSGRDRKFLVDGNCSLQVEKNNTREKLVEEMLYSSEGGGSSKSGLL